MQEGTQREDTHLKVFTDPCITKRREESDQGNEWSGVLMILSNWIACLVYKIGKDTFSMDQWVKWIE